MTYTTEVFHFIAPRTGGTMPHKRKRFNSLAAARKCAWKSVRKFGNVVSQNWGERGGDFPSEYVQAIITCKP